MGPINARAGIKLLFVSRAAIFFGEGERDEHKGILRIADEKKRSWCQNGGIIVGNMQACLEIFLGWIKKNVKNYTFIVRCFVYPKEYSLGNHQWHKWAVKFQVIGRGIGGLATFTTIKRHRRLINHTMKKRCIQTANRSATSLQRLKQRGFEWWVMVELRRNRCCLWLSLFFTWDKMRREKCQNVFLTVINTLQIFQGIDFFIWARL